MRIFKENKINFYRLQTIIQDYVQNYPVCIQKSNTINRQEPVYSINIESLNQRYEFDLTYLNEDLQLVYGIKYILLVIDAFSRKGMIYGHNSKDSDNILNDIIEYCLNNGFPKEFLCDNGPEFCIKNYIKYMHGISNNPHSHGTIERFNYTVKIYLSKEFISNNYKKLNFSSVRIRIINF